MRFIILYKILLKLQFKFKLVKNYILYNNLINFKKI